MSATSSYLEIVSKTERYAALEAGLRAMLDGERDPVLIMSTVACELHHAFDYFHWTGFYRVVQPELLAVGPYQGGHGCLYIPFDRGVCGACARTGETQWVRDVHQRTDHIACSSTTMSEVVVPIVRQPSSELVAVLDIDSDQADIFDDDDIDGLTKIAALVGQLWEGSESAP